MKKNLKKSISLIFCAILLSSSLASCSSATNEPPSSNPTDRQPSNQIQADNSASQKVEQTETPTSPSNPNTSDKNHNIEKDKYEAQITYYMELTESLQAELVKLKETAYIDECEYKLKIESLEETISLLEATIDTLSVGTNPPSVSPDKPSLDPPDFDKVVSQSEFKYTTSDGKVTITGYIGNSLDVVIPSNIDGFPVTDIGEAAFRNAYVRSVVIPSSVRHIGWFTFSGCTCLESITLPSSILSIEYGAFDYCPKSLTVKCDKGSYAEAYAKSWGMRVETN